MYGWIHQSIKQLILRKYGNDVWCKIIELANLEDVDEIDMHYPDEETNRLVSAVSTIVGVPVEEVWEAYGGFLTQFTMETGWNDLLRVMGTDLKTFLDNLDALHYFIDHVVYNARLKGPSFRCDQGQDGSLFLHYYSKRNGLFPIVKGAVREIARRIFHIEIVMRVVERKMELIDVSAEGGGRLEEHVIFHIRELKKEGSLRDSGSSIRSTSSPSNMLVPMQLDLDEFCEVFPYHLCFDKDLVIKHCGVFITKVIPHIVGDETKLSHICEIVHPEIPMTFDNFNHFMNSVFVFKLKGTRKTFATNDVLRLKGQMMLLENKKTILYLCTPYLTTVRELVERGMYIGDLPLHDATRDLILLNQSRISLVETSKKLEEATRQMTMMAKALKIEKDRADQLLIQLLPPTIAESLKAGKAIEPCEFNESTHLFSDIVKFTTLCSQCTPIQVVELLSDLYSRFDRLISINDVFKVETIGDAYLVVGGVPNIDEHHAEKIVNQAIGMLFECKQVQSPVSDSPIRMRIGIHSGPITAGVVGQKMPRYCLFGETVNIAHMLEAEGISGRILISESTYQYFKPGSLEVEERGVITIREKQIMVYLLIRNNRKSVWELAKREKGPYNTTDGYHELYEKRTSDVSPEPVIHNNIDETNLMKARAEATMPVMDSDVGRNKVCTIV